jgi:hypothetical protein
VPIRSFPRIAMPDPRHLRGYIDSFELSLRAGGKSKMTIEIYTAAVNRFVGRLAERPERVDWTQ